MIDHLPRIATKVGIVAAMPMLLCFHFMSLSDGMNLMMVNVPSFRWECNQIDSTW